MRTNLTTLLAPVLLSALVAGCSSTETDTVLASVGASGSTTARREAPPVTFSETEYGVAASPRLAFAGSAIPKGGGHAKVGKPYQVRGVWYTPKEEPGYDRTGRASWYGPNFHGRKTANGEVFDQDHLSAAHTTFPLPSYARVTNKANGRSVVVRVNDRGPYSHKRIIDVSRKVAEVLAFKHAGTADVRVEYLGRAPLHGDDTSQLMASVKGPGADAPGIGGSGIGGRGLGDGGATRLANAAAGLKRFALPGVSAKAASNSSSLTAASVAVPAPAAGRDGPLAIASPMPSADVVGNPREGAGGGLRGGL